MSRRHPPTDISKPLAITIGSGFFTIVLLLQVLQDVPQPDDLIALFMASAMLGGVAYLFGKSLSPKPKKKKKQTQPPPEEQPVEPSVNLTQSPEKKTPSKEPEAPSAEAQAIAAANQPATPAPWVEEASSDTSAKTETPVT